MTNIFILAQLIWRVPVVRRQLSWVHPSWTQRALLEFLLRCPESYQCENDKMISRNIGFHEATSIVATGTTTCFFLILASLGGRCRSRVGLMTSSRKAFLSKHHTSESCMLSTAGGYPMKGRHVLGSIPNIKGLHRIANDTVKFKGCLKRKVDLDEENDLFSVKPVCYQLINSHQRSSPGWQWWWQILGPGYAKTAGAGGFVDVPNMSQTFKHVLHSWLTFLVNHWWNYWG